MSDNLELKINLSPMEKKLLDEIVNERDCFDTPEAFLKRAIDVYLTWEKQPRQAFAKWNDPLYPFTDEQKIVADQLLASTVKELVPALQEAKNDEMEKHNKSRKEENLPKLKKDYDNVLDWIESEWTEAKRFEKEHTKYEMLINYDKYPILYRFYSRLLPAKIAIITLAHMMYRKKRYEIELDEFKIEAYDIAEEVCDILSKYEEDKNLKRNQCLSTGLPNLSGHDDTETKYIVQKRFKDQYLGKTRNQEKDNKEVFDGALSALGLIQIFKKNVERENKYYVTLSPLGKEFLLLRNQIIDEEYGNGAFSQEESEFLFSKVLPNLKVEKSFIDETLNIIEKSNEGESVIEDLDEAFKNQIQEYIDNNPKSFFKRHLEDLPTKHDEIKESNEANKETNKKIKQSRIMAFRVATLGRLVEMKKIEWEIGPRGKSIYSIKT